MRSALACQAQKFVAVAGQSDTFLCAEDDTHLLEKFIPALAGAPLKAIRTTVLDSHKKGRGHNAPQPPCIKVSPPEGSAARLHAQAATRRPNDRKSLTEHGYAALERSKNRNGQVHKDSIAWRLEYRCRGSMLCDMPPGGETQGCQCVVRIVYSATIRQIASKQVLIKVFGNSTEGGSLHSIKTKWDPFFLRRTTLADIPRQRAIAAVREKELLSLKVDTVRAQLAAEQSVARDLDVEKLQQSVDTKQREYDSAKRKTREPHSQEQRNKILALALHGHGPAAILARLPAPKPDLAYVHSVVNNERRRTGPQKPQFEAVKQMCRDLLGESGMVILFHPDSQSIDPARYPIDTNGVIKGKVPCEAMHCVVMSTIERIDHMLHADGIGSDVKWRTCEAGKSVIHVFHSVPLDPSC